MIVESSPLVSCAEEVGAIAQAKVRVKSSLAASRASRFQEIAGFCMALFHCCARISGAINFSKSRLYWQAVEMACFCYKVLLVGVPDPNTQRRSSSLPCYFQWSGRSIALCGFQSPRVSQASWRRYDAARSHSSRRPWSRANGEFRCLDSKQAHRLQGQAI